MVRPGKCVSGSLARFFIANEHSTDLTVLLPGMVMDQNDDARDLEFWLQAESEISEHDRQQIGCVRPYAPTPRRLTSANFLV
jgi:hypothetical protein